MMQNILLSFKILYFIEIHIGCSSFKRQLLFPGATTADKTIVSGNDAIIPLDNFTMSKHFCARI